MARVRVLTPITHLGVNHAAGAVIEIDEGTAYQLVAAKVVARVAPVEAAKPVAPAQTKGGDA